MIEETDTDIEVRKYADAQAARELGIELYPRSRRHIDQSAADKRYRSVFRRPARGG